jgi:ketosteroid isomerase-like protein
MSQENVEIVRELYAGWVRGDFSVRREHFDPDVEWALLWLPEQVTARGTEAMREAWRQFLGNWHDWRTGDIERLIDGGDRVTAYHQIFGQVKHGQPEISRPGVAVFTFRDGKIISLLLTDPDGLEAAGLRE